MNQNLDTYENYQFFFQNSIDLLCIADLNGYFKLINFAFQKLLGYTESELTGKPFLEYVHPDDLKATLTQMEKLNEGQKVLNFMNRYQKNNGTYVWLSWRAHVKDGLILATARDLSQTKMVEDFLYSILEGINDSVITINQQGIIQSVNQAAISTFGYSEKELIGQNVSMLMPHTEAEHNRFLGNYLKSGVKKIIGIGREVVSIDKDGNEIPVHLSVSETHLGSESFFTGVVRDISDLKEKEIELVALNKELGRSNSELENFVYIASHDLKEPLRKIYAFSKILLDQIPDLLSGDQHKYFDFMIDGANRMNIMIEGLVDYSRINSEKRAFQFTNIKNIVESVTQINLAGLIESHNATVHLELDEFSLQVDQVKMSQLFQNLISNAIKFVPKSRDPEVTVRSHILEGNYMFEIIDNGIGIREIDRDKIFILFRRLNRKEDYEGTGIGLAICKKIVGLHGGNIWVESREGEGSIFKFTLSKDKEK